MRCEICPAKQQCDETGREKFLAQLGQCQNCKAMSFVGRWKHNEQNVGHKTTIDCATDNTGWMSKPLEEDVMPRGRCGICGSHPLRVKRWKKKVEAQIFGEKYDGK